MRSPELRFALLCFLVAIAYWPDIPSAVVAPRWVVIEIGATALLLLTPIRMTLAHWWGLAFISWCALSLAWSAQSDDSQGALVQLVALAAVFCVAAELRDSDKCLIGLGAGAMVAGIIALMQVNGIQPIPNPLKHTIGWPIATFGNKNFMAGFCALAFLGMLFVRIKYWFKIPLLFGAGLGAILPMSRGALAAGLIAIWAWWVRDRSKWFWGLALAGVAVVIALDVYLHPLRLISSISPRLEMWDWTISNFRWLGYGIGTYGSVFPWEHASFDLLEIVFNVGVGAALLLPLLAYCLRERTCDAEWTILAAVLVESLTGYPLHQPAPVFVAAFVAGRLAGERRRAGDLKYARRIYCEPRAENTYALGAGTLSFVDIGRADLPIGQEHPQWTK